MRNIFLIPLSVLIVLLGSAALFIWTGVYNIAAAEPHTALVQWLLVWTLSECKNELTGHSLGLLQ